MPPCLHMEAEMSAAEILSELGLDPIIPLPLAADAAGVTTQTLKNIARQRPEDLTSIRVSERRCGIRRSVLDRFLATRQSALTVSGKTTPARLGAMAKTTGKRSAHR